MIVVSVSRFFKPREPFDGDNKMSIVQSTELELSHHSVKAETKEASAGQAALRPAYFSRKCKISAVIFSHLLCGSYC